MTAGTLLILACLVSRPVQCQQFRLPVERCSLPMETWQAYARWNGEHPDWSLRKLSCEEGERA